LYISYPIDNNVDNNMIEGAKLVGNSDQLQKNESAVYTANFGGPICPQRLTHFSRSKRTIEVDAAIGYPHGRRVITQDIAYEEHSLASSVRELYEQEVLSIIKDKDLLLWDCWYGKHHDTKKGR
jgi:hypothetical protein